jgi:High potential iron-sulfur protein
MNPPPSLSRRRLLERLALAVPLIPLALRSAPAALAADAPLLSVSAPEAQAVKYVEDAKEASGATPGNNCANCALYQGAYGSTQGPCQLFAGKLVKAGGWCTAWAPQI